MLPGSESEKAADILKKNFGQKHEGSFSCGKGSDVVFADAQDDVAVDCELVRRA